MAKKLFIGVDLGGTSIRAGVVNARGEVLALEKRKTHPEVGVDGVFARLVGAIARVITKADLKARNLGGIGVGVPGPVDSEQGVVRVAVNLGKGWRNMPLAEKLSAHFAVPVFINNDVRVGALGEHRHGAGRGVQDMVAIFVGTGIGGGLILGGQLRGGAPQPPSGGRGSPDAAEYAAAKARYIEKLPFTEFNFTLGDFGLFRFTPNGGRYVGGFARAHDLTLADLQRAAALQPTA